MSDQSFDEILEGKEPEQPEVTEEPKEETSEQPRDESGRFATKETGEQEREQPAEPVTPTEQSEEEKGQLAALKAERAKRQELEAEIERMQQHYRQQAPEQQKPKPDFWDNPDAYLEQRFQELAPTLMQQMEQRQTIQRVDQSEKAFRNEHPDFDEKLAAFQQQATPQLIQQMAESENPAKFAYDRGRAALELQQVGSIEELEARLRAKWEAEARAQVPAPKLPQSTVNDSSVAARGGPEWGGPKPMSDLLS